MIVDDKTLERAIGSAVVSLHQAYMVTRKLTPQEAEGEVMKFIIDKVLVGILKCNPDEKYDKLKTLFDKAVDRMLEEYKDKQDKSYTALLKLKDMLR